MLRLIRTYSKIRERSLDKGAGVPADRSSGCTKEPQAYNRITSSIPRFPFGELLNSKLVLGALSKKRAMKEGSVVKRGTRSVRTVLTWFHKFHKCIRDARASIDQRQLSRAVDEFLAQNNELTLQIEMIQWRATDQCASRMFNRMLNRTSAS